MIDNRILEGRGLGKMDANTRHVQGRVSAETYKALKLLAAKQGQNMQQILSSMIEATLSLHSSKDVAEIAHYEDERMNRFAMFLHTAPPPARTAVMTLISQFTPEKGGKRKSAASAR